MAPWSPRCPVVYTLPCGVVLPYQTDIQSSLGEIGYIRPDGHCGYNGALAGLIILHQENPMSPIQFWRKIYLYLIANLDQLLNLVVFCTAVESHTGLVSIDLMQRWVCTYACARDASSMHTTSRPQVFSSFFDQQGRGSRPRIVAPIP